MDRTIFTSMIETGNCGWRSWDRSANVSIGSLTLTVRWGTTTQAHSEWLKRHIIIILNRPSTYVAAALPVSAEFTLFPLAITCNEDSMHVPTKPINKYPWFIRLFFWNQKRRYGKVLEPGLLWGRSPWVFATLALLYGSLDRKRSPLSPVLRSLITVRVSQINHCEFCVDINSATLVKRGVPESKIKALWEWQESPLFDQIERVALEYTEAVTHSELHVTDDLMARVKEHFDDDAVVELTALIAFQNLSSKFNDALNVAPQGFCRLPPVAPPATNPDPV
jgi:AhpD family alkylhydroperoxidase